MKIIITIVVTIFTKIKQNRIMKKKLNKIMKKKYIYIIKQVKEIK